MASSRSSAPLVDLHLMGRFVVARDGTEIPAADFGGRKVRMLLRVLATRRGGVVPSDELIDLLWPGRPPADPPANLQVLVNRARRATGTPWLIVTVPAGYALTADESCTVDTEQFLQAAADCGTRTGPAALAAHRSAIAQFHGEPLAEDRYEAWAQPFRDAILLARQQLLEQGATTAITCGEPALAVGWAAQAAADEPLREAATLTLVRALAAGGDRAAALREYDRFRRLLADELGLDPSPEAAALHAALLAGRPADHPIVARTAGHIAPVDGLAFVGRQAELDQMLAAVSSAGSAGRRGFVLVSGPSGSGKSRLLAAFASRVPAVAAAAFWPHRAEPWALARTVLNGLLEAEMAAADALPAPLRTALDLLLPGSPPGARTAAPAGVAWRGGGADGRSGTDTGQHADGGSGTHHGQHADGGSDAAESRPPSADPESVRALIIEAAARLVGALRGVVLIVDDLQWADPSSVRLLEAVAHRARQVTMVLAYRSDEWQSAGPAADFVRRLPIDTSVQLGGLPVDAIGELVVDHRLATALADATDRTPLAIGEVLQALSREGSAGRDSAGRWRGTSPVAAAAAAEHGRRGQRAAIARRAARHSGITGGTLSALALLGRQAPARLLAVALGADEHSIAASLSVLSTAGLVRLGDEGWGTAHDMVAEVIVGGMPPGDSGALHGDLARALEATGADPAEIARHWSWAGDVGRAGAAYGSAAAAALEIFADAEAEQLADAGLALPAPADVASTLHERRAQARRRLGDIRGARADFQAALTTRTGGRDRAALLAELASLASGADDLVRASHVAELAVIEAGDDESVRARALEVASVIDMNLDMPERAAQRAQEALNIFRRHGDSRGAARILDARAMATFMAGDVRGGTEMLHRSAELFADCGDLMRLITPRSTRGHGLVFQDRAADGLVDITAALEVANRLGHPEGQAYALWHRAEALSALDRAAEAAADGALALSIARNIGHRGWTATAWRAIGIAEQTAGDLDRALECFRRSMDSCEHLDLFGSWAAARSALVLVGLGRLAEAQPLIERALASGPPLSHFEGRLAQVELAHARAADTAETLAREALRRAVTGGVLAHAARLSVLAGGSEVPGPPPAQ